MADGYGTDLLDLYTSPDAVARARADAMSQRAQGLQGAGMVLHTLMGDRDPVGGMLAQTGGKEMERVANAIQGRPTYQQHAEVARQMQAENEAWRDPRAAGLLRQGIQQFMPNLPIDESTPVQVLRNMAPLAEKFGQSYNALALRQALHGLQVKTDPITKQQYQYDPISGARYTLDGRPLTPGLRGPLFRGGAVPGPGGLPPGAGGAQGPAGGGGQGPLRSPAAPKAPVADGDIGAPEPRNAETTSLEKALRKDLDYARASSRSVFGQAGNVMFRGARILPLLLRKDENGNPIQPTGKEWQDIAAQLVAMQTGGVPPEQMTMGIVPHDAAGNWADMKSWLFAKPFAPDRQEWIERFVDNVNREDKAAKEQILSAQLQALGGHTNYATQYPNRMKMNLRSYGLDPKLVDQIRSGKYQGPAPGEPAHVAAPLSAKDQQAKAWAEAHPGDPMAVEILKSLGTGK